YDANSDPVVRITAGEVRKRLTQHYYDPAHRGEVILELPTGSYVPLFREPERFPAAEPPAAAIEASVEAATVVVPPAPSRLWRYRWALGAGLGATVVLAGA